MFTMNAQVSSREAQYASPSVGKVCEGTEVMSTHSTGLQVSHRCKGLWVSLP